MNQCVIGIDPGLGGGIAIISDEGIALEAMPRIENEIDVQALNAIIANYARRAPQAFVEKVGAMPGQGVTSMFKFGKVCGIVEGVLVANGININYVRPQAWMKLIHGDIRGDDPKERNRKAFAEIFPDVDARRTMRSVIQDSGLVDAALIAEYGRRSIQ